MLVYRSMLLLTSLLTYLFFGSLWVLMGFWFYNQRQICDMRTISNDNMVTDFWPRWPQKRPFKNIFQKASKNNTLCIFACAKLNVIKKICEMFQWKKDIRIPTTDITQECLLFSVKRYGWRSHNCRKKVAKIFRVNINTST